MEPCPSCKKEIAFNATTCPHCGHERDIPSYGWHCISFGLLFLFLLIIGLGSLEKVISAVTEPDDGGKITNWLIYLGFLFLFGFASYYNFMEWKKRL